MEKDIFDVINSEPVDLVVLERIVKANPKLLIQTNPQGLTPLHIACKMGKAPLVSQLLQFGADPNQPTDNTNRMTPLFFTLYYYKDDANTSARIFAALVEGGATTKVKAKGPDGKELQLNRVQGYKEVKQLSKKMTKSEIVSRSASTSSSSASMSETPPSSVERAVSKRKGVVIEFRDVEAQYALKLRILRKAYFDKITSFLLENKDKLPLKTHHIQYADSLLGVGLGYNLELLRQILYLLIEWNDVKSEFGTMFSSMARFFQSYKNYFHVKYSLDMAIAESMKKSAKFLAVIKEGEAEAKNMLPPKSLLDVNVSTLLQAPLKHLQQYPLLLGALLKETPETMSDHKHIKAAIEVMQNTLTLVNSSFATRDAIEQVEKIAVRIEDLPEDVVVLQPARSVLKEGPLVFVGRNEAEEQLVFLFNDMLLITRKKGVAKYTINSIYKAFRSVKNIFEKRAIEPSSNNGSLPLLKYVESLGLDELLVVANVNNNRFVLINSDNGLAITLEAADDKVKSDWIAKIREASDIVAQKRNSIHIEIGTTESINEKELAEIKQACEAVLAKKITDSVIEEARKLASFIMKDDAYREKIIAEYSDSFAALCRIVQKKQRDFNFTADWFPRIDIDALTFNDGAALGQGSFGIVRKAQYKAPDNVVTEVAVKILPDLKREFDLSNVRRELAIMSLCGTAVPNMIRLIGYGTKERVDMGVTEVRHIFVLELMDMDLSKLLEESHKNLPVRVRLQIAADIALAMKQLHKLRILHRDLKSANILLKKSGNGYITRIGDFGLARSAVNTDMTMASMATVVGTPIYMDPNLFDVPPGAKSDKINNKSDVYGFGVILWELATGKKPFEGMSFDHFSAIMKDAAKKEITPPLARPDNTMPPECLALIERCRVFNQASRPEFSEIYDIFSALLDKTA